MQQTRESSNQLMELVMTASASKQVIFSLLEQMFVLPMLE